MSVLLTPKTEALIRQRVDDGHYSSPSELIEDALEALDEREAMARLREAIAIGDSEFERGEGIPYSSELMAQIRKDAEAAIQRGDRPGSDVVP